MEHNPSILQPQPKKMCRRTNYIFKQLHLISQCLVSINTFGFVISVIRQFALNHEHHNSSDVIIVSILHGKDMIVHHALDFTVWLHCILTKLE